MKFRLLLLILALAVFSSTPALGNDYGCTPGYWKNHTSAWELTAYTPNQTVISVFGMADLNFSDGTSLPAGTTLIQALNGGGGSGMAGAAKIYLRAVVAKLLNISAGIHDEADDTEFKGYVQNAIDTFTREGLITDAAIWDADNNAPLGCPLN